MTSENRQYFMVGTILHGWDPKDKIPGSGEQLQNWIKSGKWQLGLQSHAEKSPKYLKQVRVLRKVQIGDILVAKQMDPDFKTTWIKAVGICIRESTDSHTIGVNWVKDLTNKQIMVKSSYRATIAKMSDDQKPRTIINQIIIPLLDDVTTSK